MAQVLHRSSSALLRCYSPKILADNTGILSAKPIASDNQRRPSTGYHSCRSVNPQIQHDSASH